ncbi:MAG: aminotransferase class I/II-fold pyridoxal phosphate-dependent enzyme [Sporolactobacillus sp.]
MVNPRVEDSRVSLIRLFDERTSSIEGIIKLTIGEPDFNTPKSVKNAAIDAINENYSHYAKMGGMPELKMAAAHYINEKYNLHYDDPLNQVIITVGAKEALSITFQTLLQAGDRVLIPVPTFPAYATLCKLQGAIPISLNTSKSGLKLTAANLQKHLETVSGAKVLVLNYPNNPTGLTYTRQELIELAEVARNHDLYIVSDEIYSELTFNGHHTSIAEFYPEKTILINGLSKSHAMTGWRIGFLYAPKALTKLLIRVHHNNVTGPATLIQKASITAVTEAKDAAASMRHEYEVRKNIVRKGLLELGFAVPDPDSGFYLFVKIPKSLFSGSSLDFCVDLAKNARVAAIPGKAFGEAYDDYFRISCATSRANLIEALSRIEAYVRQREKFEHGFQN